MLCAIIKRMQNEEKVGFEIDNLASTRKKIRTNYFIIAVFAMLIGGLIGANFNKIAPALTTSTDELNLSQLQTIYQRLIKNYDGEIDREKLLEGSIKGLVYGLGDDHSIYMTKEEAKNFQENLTGDIGGGIGAEIGMRNSLPTIVRPLKNNPAMKAGLLAGDIILKVNDEDTSGQTLEAVVLKIRGPADSTVKLTIARKGHDEPLEFKVVRAIVDNPSVELSYQGQIAILTVYRFDNDTSNLMRKAAHEIKLANSRGVILDLRDNTGGVLDAVSGAAGLWIDNQIVVTQKHAGKVIDTIRSTRGQAELANLSTIVLVNENTASASEILAAALRDYDKAKLVGEKTYGKGSVQELTSTAGGQLKLTVAHWFTAKDQTIEKNGLVPDVEIKRADKNNQNLDEQVAKALELLN